MALFYYNFLFQIQQAGQINNVPLPTPPVLPVSGNNAEEGEEVAVVNEIRRCKIEIKKEPNGERQPQVVELLEEDGNDGGKVGIETGNAKSTQSKVTVLINTTDCSQKCEKLYQIIKVNLSFFGELFPESRNIVKFRKILII